MTLLLALLLALPACASAEQPYEIQVRGSTRDALQEAIDACPRGYAQRKSGCQVRLPAGTLRGRWKVGGTTGATVQESVCLVGQGPGLGNTETGGQPGAGGTILVYEGPPGGAVLEFAGGDFPCVRDITIAMEGAAVGVRFNAGASPIQGVMLERVAIAGNAKRPAGIGLQITGTEKNNQVDALLAQALQIDFVDVGVEVDSMQAVTNRIGPGSKISASSSAVRVKSGSLSLDGVLTQCRTANCCTYDLLPGHGYFRVRDGYHEIGAPPARNAKVLCMNRASPPAVGSWHMASIVESYFNLQCDASRGPCAIPLLDAVSNVGVVFRDNWILSNQPDVAYIPRTFAKVIFKLPTGNPPTGRLVWQGNSIISGMGGIQTEIAPGVRVEAITGDDRRIWNDLNLDGRWDPSEPTSSTR
jgi:hypothetical protein